MTGKLQDVPLDELPRRAGQPTSVNSQSVEFEFQRRQTKAQIEAADATVRAAEAAVSSANYAEKTVKWMFWSVMVLAAASVVSLVLDLLTFLQGGGRG